MTDVSQEQRWAVYLAQAQSFAKRENFLDAVGRAGLVVDEVRAALEGATDAESRLRLSQMLLRAEKQRDALQARFDAWNGRIAAHRQKVMDDAAAEMARPLPNPPPDVPKRARA